jgi:uncharacterized protein YdaU (DUF1376 family)
MHYYKRNIGDYAKKAGRLSMLQHGSYTLLMDACYDRERWPTLAEAIEWTWASTQDEIDAVTFVLNRFFLLQEGVYVQERIQEEIARYHANAATNQRIAVARETKRKAEGTKRAPRKTKREQVVDEPPPNHKPLTTNQEPIEERKSANAPPLDQVPDELLKDYLEVRRAKKAGKLTQTAIEGIDREAKLAGLTLEQALRVCCEQGWQGFKAVWYANLNAPSRVTSIGETPHQRNTRMRVAEIAPEIARRAPGDEAPPVNPVDFFRTVEAVPRLGVK